VGTSTPTGFRVITLDRTNPSPKLADIVYVHPRVLDRRDLGILLRSRPTVDELRRGANLSSSSLVLDPRRHDRQELSLVGHATCVVGIVRFLKSFYLVLVTDKRRVGYINGHAIYGVQQSRLHSVYCAHDAATTGGASASKPAWSFLRRGTDATDDAEERYLSLFQFLDLTKDFFFSFTYDLTNTLQTNVASATAAAVADEFMWNHFLTAELVKCLPSRSLADSWVVPLVHGSFGQQRCSLYGSAWTLTLLGRRSRFYAGTRYLKRGVNEHGHVANHVEVEQVVESDAALASFCQVRGSIPLFWSQETSPTLPKPPIRRFHYDATFRATREHFAQLMDRHGAPVVVLNLVKQVEKVPKESLLGDEYREAVTFLNTGLERARRIVYEALDFKRASKAGEAVVLRQLERIAERALDDVGIFSTRGRVQTGTVRVNCIDGLDRTNVGQFCVGLCALSRMLQSAGVAGVEPSLDRGGTLVLLFMDLFEQLGDTIAQQYGGSLAHKKGAGAGNVLLARQREMLTSIQRYYSNSFTDFAKQDAINLFLGRFVPRAQGPVLWTMESDFYLHNERVTSPTFTLKPDVGVDDWYTPRRAAEPARVVVCPRPPPFERDVDALVSFDDVLADGFFRPVQVMEDEADEPLRRLTSMRGGSLSTDSDGGGGGKEGDNNDEASLETAGSEEPQVPSGLTASNGARAASSPAYADAPNDLAELRAFVALTHPEAVFAAAPDAELVEFMRDYAVAPADARGNLAVMRDLAPETVVSSGDFAGVQRGTAIESLYAPPQSAALFDFAAKSAHDRDAANARLERERAVFQATLLSSSSSLARGEKERKD